LHAGLSQLETRYFANDHEDQSNDARLERLEKFIFGEAKEGSEQQRMEALLAAIPKETPLPSPKSTHAASESQHHKDASPETAPPAAPVQPPPNSSDYPTVSKLESLIIGESFAGEPIQRRLDRLETKAFGQASDSSDLTARVDRLKGYAGLQSQFSEDDYVPPEVANRWANPEATLASGGILQNVFQLEQNVFGRSYARKSMIDRVGTLERAVFPTEQSTTGMSLPERIDRLVSTVGSERTLSGYPPESQAAAPAEPLASAPSTQPAPVVASNNPPANPTRGGRSFLRGLGKALGIAGQVALGALGSGCSSSFMSGSYMSGSSFGFGGFSPGFGMGLGGIGF
jgi:hypothetical protein